MKLELVKTVSEDVPQNFQHIAELLRIVKISVLRAFSKVFVISLG